MNLSKWRESTRGPNCVGLAIVGLWLRCPLNPSDRAKKLEEGCLALQRNLDIDLNLIVWLTAA